MSSFTLAYTDLGIEVAPQAELDWPRLWRGAIIRGAMGSILREVACEPLCPGPERCRFASQCAFQNLFAPRTPRSAQRLSLNADRPRPYVVIPEEGGGDRVAAGSSLRFSIRLFGVSMELWPYVALVFSELVERGLGPKRVPCTLRSMSMGERSFDMRDQPGSDAIETRTLRLDLPSESDPASDLEVRFLTPVLLKEHGREKRRAAQAFAALVKRARDRLSSLYHFYGGLNGQPPAGLDWDFQGLGRQSESVDCLKDRTVWRTTNRTSTRTGLTHPMSGLVGRVVFADVPAQLSALLRLASETHVGKHAAFGLGRIAVRESAAP